MTVLDLPTGVAVAQFDTVDSTNKVALARIAAGEKGPLWITAQQQTAGRGRRGRDWISGQGNLFASLIWSPEALFSSLSVLPFAMGLAVRQALIALGVPQDRIALKWPNDVLVDGKKISGCLIERTGADQASPLAIGIGINVVAAPQGDTAFPATSVCDQNTDGKAYTAYDALRTLAFATSDVTQQWKTLGPASIMNSWRACAWGMGKRQTIRTNGQEYLATLVRVEDDGCLLVNRGQGEEPVYAGDVFALS